ncbi:MAG: heme lyase NrfEFG subunit NrfE, partial [Chitinophagaceae bacterium]
VIVGGSLILFALRAPVVKSEIGFNWFARETLLLANNILLGIVMLIVLVGTLYPLIADALHWGKISVGTPYFNGFFVPLMGLLCVLMAIGPVSNWKRTNPSQLFSILWKPWMLSLLFAATFPLWYGEKYKISAVIAVFIASWITTALCADLIHRLKNSESFLSGLKKISLSYYAMVIAHLGIAVTLIGVSLTSIYSIERDLRMEEHQAVNLMGYEFTLQSLQKVKGPNYIADEAFITVTHNGKALDDMHPQKRRYYARGNLMTEVALDTGLFRDIYVAMGEAVDDKAWAMRVHVKPFVRWIWLGALMMAFGAVLSVADKRYRKKSQATKTVITTRSGLVINE